MSGVPLFPEPKAIYGDEVRRNVSGLLRDLRKSKDRLVVCALFDICEECGGKFTTSFPKTWRELDLGYSPTSRQRVFEYECVKAGLVTWDDCPYHNDICRMQEAVAAVVIDEVPVITTDRNIPRKEQAALARKLFSKLGVKMVRFTTPTYSTASTVDVEILERVDYRVHVLSSDFDPANRDHCRAKFLDPARVANSDTVGKVIKILDKAFPNHNDRSDSQTDYYNARWSFLS